MQFKFSLHLIASLFHIHTSFHPFKVQWPLKCRQTRSTHETTPRDALCIHETHMRTQLSLQARKINEADRREKLYITSRNESRPFFCLVVFVFGIFVLSHWSCDFYEFAATAALISIEILHHIYEMRFDKKSSHDSCDTNRVYY